jgi:hypothetical protein
LLLQETQTGHLSRTRGQTRERKPENVGIAGESRLHPGESDSFYLAAFSFRFSDPSPGSSIRVVSTVPAVAF